MVEIKREGGGGGGLEGFGVREEGKGRGGWKRAES